MKQKKRTFRIIGLTVLGLLLLLLTLPFLIPLSHASTVIEQKPFQNSGRADIRGFSFHYRTYVPTADAVKGKVLMIHGLGGSTFSYEKSAMALVQEGWLCILADLPGFGYSSRDPGYDHSQNHRAEDLWLLLDKVDKDLESGLAKMPWHLMGHSMGGGTVAAMAVQNEFRTASLIFIDPALSQSQGGGFLTQLPPVTRWLQVALERIFFTEGGVRRFLTSAYGRDPTLEEVRGYLAPLTLPGTARAVSSLLKTSGGPDPALLGQLSVPILAVWGSEDTWVPLSESGKLKEICPDAVILEIKGAAHCPMETHTDEFVRIVLDWLEPKDVAGSHSVEVKRFI